MSQPDVYQASLALHRQHQGKLGVQSLIPLKSREDLSLAYTPGVAEACREIVRNPAAVSDLTIQGRLVAVISDGSAVLGLGNIGPAAALPVMEGKSLLLKEFGGVDSLPLVINTQDTEEIIKFVRQVAPSFIGINLEDISAPRCFEIEERLQDIGIPVFHDDQQGTAIVVYAALQNAARVVGKPFADLRVVIVGAGAAGMAVAKMLLAIDTRGDQVTTLPAQRVRDVILVDSKGIVESGRADVVGVKVMMAAQTNIDKRQGSLAVAMAGADVIIGVAGPGLITTAMVSAMAPKAIVMAMANPTPEIMPNEAKAAGAAVVATGRSDFPNQVNNVLAFPGIFRAVVRARLPRITPAMRYAAAAALAQTVAVPTAEAILPSPFLPNLAELVAQAVLDAA